MRKSGIWAYTTVFLLVAAFAIDLATPLGVADWWAYTVAIVTALLWRGRATTVWVALVAACLTVLGGVLSPDGDPTQGWVNRFLGVLLCILLGGLCWWLGKKGEEIEQAGERLRLLVEDRDEIRRDLHDGILQELYGLGLGLDVARSEVTKDPEAAAAQIEEAIAGLNAVMRALRSVISGAEAAVLKEDDLETALRTLADRLSSNCELRLEREAVSALTKPQARQLVYITAEAMSNSMRHSKAQHSVLSLAMREDLIVLKWEDDGIGFDHTGTNSRGHGMRNMKRRAQKLRAHFDVASAPGAGTRVLVEIPREARAA